MYHIFMKMANLLHKIGSNFQGEPVNAPSSNEYDSII